MRVMTLDQLNKKIEKNRSLRLLEEIDKIVESSPNYTRERKRPKDKTEARILKRFQYK